MTPLGCKILEALAGQPLNDEALAEKLSDGGGFWSSQAIAVAVRGMRVEGSIRRIPGGLLEACQSPAPATSGPTVESTPAPRPIPMATPAPKAAAPIPARETNNMTTVKCGKCGSTDFTAGGKCRACKKVKNDRYLASKKSRKAATPAPPSDSPKPTVTSVKVNGAPRPLPAPAPNRMLVALFALRIEDSAGEIHALSLTSDVVKRLAVELQEYA